MKVSEGTRTPDRLDHNQELYQLSYAHRGQLNLPAPGGRACAGEMPAVAPVTGCPRYAQVEARQRRDRVPQTNRL